MNVKLNPLTLAYMGDAVLDQHVREYIVLKLQSKPPIVCTKYRKVTFQRKVKLRL